VQEGLARVEDGFALGQYAHLKSRGGQNYYLFLNFTDVLLIENPEMFKRGRELSCQCHWIL